MVLVHKLPIFQLFFLANIGKENVFYDILEQKNAIVSYKKKNYKQSKNWHFPMVLVQKLSFFQLFFFGNICQENVFYDILEQKNAFLSYKNKNFKNPKNSYFSKGGNPWFWSKNGHFPNFFFRQYRPGKFLLRYSRMKKRLSRLWKQQVYKVKKLTFLQIG